MPTIIATTKDRQLLAATPAELEQAQEVVQQLAAASGPRPLGLASSNSGEVIDVPRELSAIMAQALQIIVAGGTVTIGSMPEELTTSTAAEQLGISRPTLMKLIDRGEIRAHKVGTHTRIRTDDLMEFRRARQARRRAAFDELREMEDSS